MTKYEQVLNLTRANLSSNMIQNIEKLPEIVLNVMAQIAENAVKAALSDDPMMPYYSPAIHECRKTKIYDVDVIANLYAKEQGFKP